MEAMAYSSEFISVNIALFGLFGLLAVAMAGLLLFGYVADQETRGMRLEWLEEPLATVGPSVSLEKIEFRKAA